MDLLSLLGELDTDCFSVVLHKTIRLDLCPVEKYPPIAELKEGEDGRGVCSPATNTGLEGPNGKGKTCHPKRKGATLGTFTMISCKVSG